MATIGIVTGSGIYRIGKRERTAQREVSTPYGAVRLAEATVGRCRIFVVARHGWRHERLSHQVQHRANLWALREAGVQAVLATSVVGLLDAEAPVATPIVFDDLYFPSNRLPGGRPATFFDTPGDRLRGHLILSTPFSPTLRRLLLSAARQEGYEVLDGGCYVHSEGPRFNTRAEIGALRAIGGLAVSQTCGPEAVLAGELELPYALLGFGVDYASGVAAAPTPPEELTANLELHRTVARRILFRLIEDLPEAPKLPFDTGFVFRMEGIADADHAG